MRLLPGTKTEAGTLDSLPVPRYSSIPSHVKTFHDGPNICHRSLAISMASLLVM